ncbi:unnamed protein product, partial [Mesorhabditis belari]|uniref:Uncharacterized protein n=1 Tax=Mesorhabditis belari TaxID=2138241 RepID=A0AAF3F604_9BILA
MQRTWLKISIVASVTMLAICTASRLLGKECQPNAVIFGSECYDEACIKAEEELKEKRCEFFRSKRQAPSLYYYGLGGNVIGAYTPFGLAFNPLRVAPLTNWGRK